MSELWVKVVVTTTVPAWSESLSACETVLRAEPFCMRNRSEFDIVIVTTVPAC